MPGFGIASVFYIFAALFAPVYEILVTIRGRSSRGRWVTALTQFGLALATLVALVLFYVGIEVSINRGWLDITTSWPIRFPNWVFAVLVLGVVMAVGAVLGAIASLHSADHHPDQIAAAHRDGVAGMVLAEREAGWGRTPPPHHPGRAVPAVPADARHSGVEHRLRPRWGSLSTLRSSSDAA